MKKISVLLATKDEEMYSILEKLIMSKFKELQIIKETDGVRAYNVIKQNEPNIIIADDNIDLMDGINLCKRVRINSKYADIVYIALISNEDFQLKFSDIKDAKVDDVLLKPFFAESFYMHLKNAVEIVTVRNQMKENLAAMQRMTNEIDDTRKSMRNLPINFIKARISNYSEKADRMADMVAWIGRRFGDFDENQLVTMTRAAELADCGKLFLPDNLVKTPVVMDGTPTHDLMFQVPTQVKAMFKSSPILEDISKILFSMYENYDGTGFPDKLQYWQIPLESRIIRVAHDYIEFSKLKSKDEVMKIMLRDSKRFYDNRVITLLQQYLEQNGIKDNPHQVVKLHELEKGMIVKCDVITNSGLKLLPAGATLTERAINTLIKHNTTDPIVGDIIV